MKTSRKRGVMSRISKTPLHYSKDEESVRKKELEKAYERISVLETRVHDLTLQATIVSWN